MAITLATHGPMLETMIGLADARAQLVSLKFQHDPDVAALVMNINQIQSLAVAMTANDDTTFAAVAAELGVDGA